MDKNNPAISVIIPMFNAERYIGACLASLVNQTFQDFEVIVADDCSTDNSYGVAERFFAKFGDRLKIARSSKNSGFPSIPRNFALTAARGKYIYFLDADDFLSATAFEELYFVAEKFKADVVHPERCVAFLEEDVQKRGEIISNQTGEFVTEPMLETFDLGKRVGDFVKKRYLWWACNKLFRRQFLADNGIIFPQTMTFEDFVFVFKCVVCAGNYVRVPFVSYYYRIRKESMSHRLLDAIDISEVMMRVVKELDDFMNGKSFFQENFQYRYALFDFFIQDRLEVMAKGFFEVSDLEPALIFNYYRAKIFAAKPEENVSLMAYFFVAMNIFKLYTKRQEKEIAELKTQLARQ